MRWGRHSTVSWNATNHVIQIVGDTHTDTKTIRLFSLTAEVLDLVFISLSYGDRWCFALSCKAAARYALTGRNFLVVSCPSLPRLSRGYRLTSRIDFASLDVVPRSEAFREVMRTLSKGWVGKGLHWCDQCRKFRRFPWLTREEWYGVLGDRRLTVEGMRERRGWVQDIGLSVDGLICWNHSCPDCMKRWKTRLPVNSKKTTWAI